MHLLWPWFLLLFMLIPLLIAVYLLILRRKRRFAIRYSSISLIREAVTKRSRWRQHLPFVLFLIGSASLITAMARPVAEIEVPLSRTTIILALDVSLSMWATDVSPNRLSVALDAALNFIEDQADGTQFSIVAFADFAEVIVPPTNDKEVLQEAVTNLTTSLGGTAIGSATLKSIDAISEVNTAVAPSGTNLGIEDSKTRLENPIYQPDIIVLLTDGVNTHGPLPLDVAQQAADRHVRVYTIGFGTTELDESTLQGLADTTGGAYFRAENSDQLYDIFLDLPTQIILQKENLEISVIFSTLAAIFITVAVILSLLWNRYS